MFLIKSIFKKAVTAIAVICFFACNDNIDEVRKMGLSSNEPIGEVENILLKHTDSGRLKVTMKGKVMRDFSNDRFAYTEFPKGIQIIIYGNKIDTTKQTIITADYAVMFDETKIADLKGNVKIVGEDGSTFNGPQLYWDQRNEWIFTDNPSKAFFANGSVTSTNRLDANQNLKEVRARNSLDNYKVDQN